MLFINAIHKFLHISSRNITKCPGPSSRPNTLEKTGGYKPFKNLSLFLGFPAIAAVATLCYLNNKRCPKEPPEFVPYEYLRRRTKRFPWGDGQKSLFHNCEMNALPDGFEEECHKPKEEEDCP